MLGRPRIVRNKDQNVQMYVYKAPQSPLCIKVPRVFVTSLGAKEGALRSPLGLQEACKQRVS